METVVRATKFAVVSTPCCRIIPQNPGTVRQNLGPDCYGTHRAMALVDMGTVITLLRAGLDDTEVKTSKSCFHYGSTVANIGGELRSPTFLV